MKNLLILIFILTSLCTKAQDTIKPSNNFIGFSFSPEYSNAIGNTGHLPKFTFSSGFNYTYKWNDKTSGNIGFIYTSRGYKQNADSTNFFYKIDSITHKRTLVKDPTQPYRIQAIIDDYYIEVPATIKYFVFKHNKFSIYLNAGASLNYLVHSNTIFRKLYEDGSIIRENQIEYMTDFGFLDRIKLGIIAGAGLQVELKKNFTFNFEPLYKFYLAPFAFSPSSTELNTIGLNICLFYNLK